ncbi:hypothetical protein F4825DRAFT_104782 [Nemania diffusa]|nr:hypothetical protein F4825DRAFT_104782 [Nemania diffusa]
MAVPNSLLGPILGGLLGFLGAIGAAIIALVLARRERVRRMDEERIQDNRGRELSHVWEQAPCALITDDKPTLHPLIARVA